MQNFSQLRPIPIVLKATMYIADPLDNNFFMVFLFMNYP
jgi:hypothetical protein